MPQFFNITNNSNFRIELMNNDKLIKDFKNKRLENKRTI